MKTLDFKTFMNNSVVESVREINVASGVDSSPRNITLDGQNPNIPVSPVTDHGTIQNLKFSFGLAHMRLQSGGWTRQVTVRELPIATTLAGVNMYLNPGGIRELHWHKETEWAYVLQGHARISVVDQNGHSFVGDVGVGDIWNFPAGIPHSIQGLDDGCEFLLVFDDGCFSEDATFQISDWFAHTPKSVLAKNFGVSESDFVDLPTDVDRTRYIFAGKIPGQLSFDRVHNHLGQVLFSHRLMEQQPIKTKGGKVRIVDTTNFSATTTISGALVEIEPGAMRELHWHPTNDEWQYYIEGSGRMTVFASKGNARTFDYHAGDVGAVPFAMGHYIENIGKTSLRFLEMFKSPVFQDISLNQWMAMTPPELVQTHLNLNKTMMGALREQKWPVVK